MTHGISSQEKRGTDKKTESGGASAGTPVSRFRLQQKPGGAHLWGGADTPRSDSGPATFLSHLSLSASALVFL